MTPQRRKRYLLYPRKFPTVGSSVFPRPPRSVLRVLARACHLCNNVMATAAPVAAALFVFCYCARRAVCRPLAGAADIRRASRAVQCRLARHLPLRSRRAQRNAEAASPPAQADNDPVLLSILTDSLARSSMNHLRVNSRCLIGRGGVRRTRKSVPTSFPSRAGAGASTNKSHRNYTRRRAAPR